MTAAVRSPVPQLYRFTAVVPRKYIDERVSCESGSDLIEFWGAVEPARYEEWHVESVSITDFEILELAHYRDDQVIDLHLHDRNSIIADFYVLIPCDTTDAAGDWLEAVLPGDWHIDEVLNSALHGAGNHQDRG